MKHMNHAEYQRKLRTYTDNQLEFVIKDARAAIEANGENPNNSYYADEMHYANAELRKRRQKHHNNAERRLAMV
jgi:hypothetical protein